MSRLVCECGRPKRRHASGCDRCIAADGRTDAERLLIAVLRALGGAATVDALLFESELPERTLYRTLTRLRQLGRVIAEEGAGRTVYRLGSNTGPSRKAGPRAVGAS